MLKQTLLTCCLALVVMIGYGQKSKTKTPASWESVVVQEKMKVGELMKKNHLPVVSEVMRHNMPAKQIQVDLTGVKQLILKTWGTENGTGWDHAVWGNAKLITDEGKEVWLSEMQPVMVQAPYGCPFYDRNFNNQKLTINGKSYDHGMMLHADGMVAYQLDGKYKKFEAEIGIDDAGTEESSVVFRVQNVDGNEILTRLAPRYGKEINAFAAQAGFSPADWLVTPDASLEMGAVRKLIRNFPEKQYYESQLAALEQMTGSKQIETAMNLLKQTLEVVRLAEQLQWVNPKAIRMALEDMKQAGLKGEKYDQLLQEIEMNYPLVTKGIYSGDQEMLTKARRVVEAKKTILLANPLLDGDKIVATRFHLGANARTAMAPALGSPENNWSSMYSAGRTGRDGEIVELSGLRGDLQIRTVYKPQRDVNIADLQMHWDADRLLFSSVDEKNRWQIYEIGIDGKNLHQKIELDEPDVEFCDANYLPDGRIIASSNIGYQGVPCVSGWDQVGNLSLYDPKTKAFRRLTFDQDGNWNPVVMNNGRVMYTRWEYTDLTHYFSRIVMHMNPDGTENKALYGSGSFWPNSTFDVKPLPGNTTKFVGIVSGHHGIARSGRLMIFDPAKSRKEEKGVVQELPFRDRKIIPEVKDELVNGVWPQFIRPCPLDDKYFLVSGKLTPDGLWGIYLVDVFDNLTCLAEFEGEGFNSPIAVVKRPVPPVIPDRVNLNDKEATIFIQDIYAGEGSMGLPRGTVKELRILAYEYAYWMTPSDHDAQGIQSGWDIKRLLGTVPVEEDGSAIFKVPANTPIAIQPLDAQGRAVQWMRSWFTPMPGETVSCIGCHEDQNQIPIPKRTIASQTKPHRLQAPEGGVRSFTFDLEIQPILDRACVACHNEKSHMNLTGGRMDTNYPRFGRPWSKSYLAIMPYVYRQGAEAEMYVLKPYEYHASNSELVRMLEKGHYGVELTDKEWKTLYNWIDFNAPYYGQFINISKVNEFDQYDRRIELAHKYNQAGVDWRKELADYAEVLKSKGAIQPVMPAPVKEIKARNVKVSGWPFDKNEAAKKQQADGKKTRQIEVAPGVTMNFVWIPAGQFVMGCNDGEADCRPAFKASVKNGFWMSECEVTNEQYCALVPEHNSRIIGQFWKDHTTPGYRANYPQYPVIRVSCEEAQAYCEKLGQKTGLKIMLPTETQWEWACRGGSGDAFWYGNNNTDFAPYENMADAMLSDMAVTGIDPKPMSKDDPLRPYWDYLPKIASVNDGLMLMGDVGHYQANPWGLKDMHGNVAEWTCSDYVDYPLKKEQTSDRKVVRGGSWTDRPKYSTAYYRKAFYPWQKVYNVGFRVIIPES